MIRSSDELTNRKIEIDLRGSDGNAFVLLGYVDTIGTQISIPKRVRNDIKKTMMMGNYDQLIKTFDIWFGNYVDLYR
jgi:hypothetical protein